MTKVHFDFETYSECNIFDAGAWAYAEHPSTRVLCMAYTYGEDDPKLWLPGDKLPCFMKDGATDYELHAWNCFFEWVIWTHVMKIPTPPLSKWHDTAALASAMALPRALGNCGEALGMGEGVSKNKRGKELIKLLSIPNKKNGDPALLREMYEYCKQDVVAERAISKVLLPLNETERRVFILDQIVNIRGIGADVKTVSKGINLYEQAQRETRDKLKQITGLDNPGSQKQFLDWMVDKGLIIDNCQKATLQAVLGVNDAKGVHEAIRLRLKLAKTAPKKFQSIQTRVGGGSRLHGNVMYHGASTGRWSSTGVNLQNIARPTLDADLCIDMIQQETLALFDYADTCPIEALSSSVRGMLVPSEGKKFIVGDYASIESRALAWLAGQEDKLEVFRGHGKMYEHAASKIFHIPIDEVTKDQRFLGKISELACGYGGGAGAFNIMATAYGTEISHGDAEKIKQEWRLANAKIVAFWYEIEQASKDAILEGGEFKAQGISFTVKNNFLWCKLPSGRLLAYHRPKVTFKKVWCYKTLETDTSPQMMFLYNPLDYKCEADFLRDAEQAGVKPYHFTAVNIDFWGVNSKNRKWSNLQTYGGKLVENITQAVARDLMAESMLLLEEAGFKIVLTVHDEIITEVDIDDKNRTAERFTTIMERPPKWASGLPIKVEAYEATRYRK